MVTPDDRAQLLLVSAVVLAVIILGLTVLLTSAVTTEIRSPDDPSTDVVEADRLAQDIERGSAGLAGQVNAMGPYENASPLRDDLDASFTTYGEFLFESIGDRRATHVELTYHSHEEGTYFADPDRGSELTVGLLTADELIPVDDAEPLAALRLSIAHADLEDDPNDTVQVHIHGDDGRSVAIAVASNATDVDLYRTRYAGDSPTFSASANVTCSANTYADLDLTRTNANDLDCHLNPFEGIEPVDGDGYGITLENADGVDGGYHFVVGDDVDALDDILGPFDEYDGDNDDEPFYSPVAWSVEHELTQLARASERHYRGSLLVYDHPRAAGYLEVPWE